MRDFPGLKVWDLAHDLTLSVYAATSAFPREEAFGLTSQLRRSAASIPANIAEGCGRGSAHELGRFMQMAMGSASELDYHLLLARDLEFLTLEKYERLKADVEQVKRMLASYIRSIRSEIREDPGLYQSIG